MCVESKPSAPHLCLSAPEDPTAAHLHTHTPSAALTATDRGACPENAEQGGPRGPQNCLPVRTATGGGHQEPTPHIFYNLCKHLTGKKPAGDAGGGSVLEQPAAGPRPPPEAWRSPANGWGAAQDRDFRGSCVRLLLFFFFFFQTILPGEDWQGLLCSSISQRRLAGETAVQTALQKSSQD